jgi:hypothetical protein
MQSSVILYTNPVRTSQETHYVSATKPNRLKLFRETVAVYCENHMEHINTLCGNMKSFWMLDSRTCSYRCTSKGEVLYTFWHGMWIRSSKKVLTEEFPSRPILTPVSILLRKQYVRLSRWCLLTDVIYSISLKSRVNNTNSQIYLHFILKVIITDSGDSDARMFSTRAYKFVARRNRDLSWIWLVSLWTIVCDVNFS